MKTQGKVSKIVIADDHGILRAGVTALLANHGDLEVLAEARDGQELMQKLESLKPDLVLIDLSMPNLDGISSIVLIRKKYPQMKIIVLTMHKNRQIFKQVMKHKIEGFLLKDEVYASLMAAVRAVLKGGQFISNEMLYGLVDDIQTNEKESISAHLLSNREKEVVTLVARGMTSRAIARELNISSRTVEGHRASIREKLRITNLADLIKFASENNLI